MITVSMGPGWVMYLIGAIILSLSGFVVFGSFEVIRLGPKTEGRVIAIEEKTYVVEYSDQGQVKIAKARVLRTKDKKPAKAVGDTVILYLNTLNPEKSKIGGFEELWMLPKILAFFAAVFFFLGTDVGRAAFTHFGTLWTPENVSKFLIGLGTVLLLVAAWKKEVGFVGGGGFLLLAGCLLWWSNQSVKKEWAKTEVVLGAHYQKSVDPDKPKINSELFLDYLKYANDKVAYYKSTQKDGHSLCLLGINHFIGPNWEYSHIVPFEVGGIRKIGTVGVVTAENVRTVAHYKKNLGTESYYVVPKKSQNFLRSTVELIQEKWGYRIKTEMPDGVLVLSKGPLSTAIGEIDQIASLVKGDPSKTNHIEFIQVLPDALIIFAMGTNSELVKYLESIQSRVL